MNIALLAFGVLLLSQATGDEAAGTPLISPPLEQAPALLGDRPGSLDWKSPAGVRSETTEETSPSTAADAHAETGDRPAEPPQLPRATAAPPDLVAAALQARDGGPTGEPITLAAALAAAADRNRQSAVVHAYWRLTLALGRANLADDFRNRLAGIEATAGSQPLWQSAHASATAVAEEAAAEVVSAQHELAGLLSRSAEQPLPLPADSPHVGPYLTHFDRLRAAGRAPNSALVIDRRLAILWQAVEARAAAAAAAEDAYQAARAASLQGTADVPTLVETAEQAHRQQRALLEVVTRYNRDIAGYALVVAPQETTGADLVRMLIEQPAEPLSPIPSGHDSAIHPTLATEPSGPPRTFASPPTTDAASRPRLDTRQPTRAVRPRPEPKATPPESTSGADTDNGPSPTQAVRPAPSDAGDQIPTPAARPDKPASGGDSSAASLSAGGTSPPSDESISSGSPGSNPPVAPVEKDLPAGAAEEPLPSLVTPPDVTGRRPDQRTVPRGSPSEPPEAAEAAADAGAAAAPRPVVPVSPSGDTQPAAASPEGLGLPAPRPPKSFVAPKAVRPTLAPHATFRANLLTGTISAAPSLYGPLREAAPARRAKQLALTLHWDRALPEGAGQPLDLAACLEHCPRQDRTELLAVFWQAREQAARYQVLADQLAWLRALTGRGDAETTEPTASQLCLESALFEARAEMHETHAALVQAQFDLAVLLGRSLDEVWPMAATPPHAGPYLPKLEDQPPEVAASRVVRRRADVLPRLGEAVRQYATAVVEADAARADSAGQFHAGEATAAALHQSICRQTKETLAFLDALSDYNRAIAAYVLAVLPPEAPAETLVSALVVTRSGP